MPPLFGGGILLGGRMGRLSGWCRPLFSPAAAFSSACRTCGSIRIPAASRCAHAGGVHAHQGHARPRRLSGHRIPQRGQDPRIAPTGEGVIHRLPGTEPGRHRPPPTTGTKPPDHPFEPVTQAPRVRSQPTDRRQRPDQRPPALGQSAPRHASVPPATKATTGRNHRTRSQHQTRPRSAPRRSVVTWLHEQSGFHRPVRAARRAGRS